MEIADELKKWTESLSSAEKRFIKIQGKIRSGSDSQLLHLFDWLNKTGDDAALPKKAAFARNLPTLAVRLRSLMLDSLYLVNKDEHIETQLSSMMTEILLLRSKKLNQAAARLLRKAKKLAYEFSRYTYIALFIENELLYAQTQTTDLFVQSIKELREEEKSVLASTLRLRELQYLHNEFLLVAKQFPFSLDPEIHQRVKSMADDPIVNEAYHSEQFLEHALAVNILGIRDMIIRDPDAAVPRYQALIRKWQKLPDWQKDQPLLLITVCKYYQIVCIYSPVDHDRISADLAFLKGFKGLPKTDLVMLQDLLYSNQFAMALNMGKFDVIMTMIAEIEHWMKKEEALLSESQLLPYLCNFLVAEFLSENFTAAKKRVNQILNLHSRKTRVDIYDFALIMRTVLQMQTNTDLLTEYSIRSGKRHFQKNRIASEFELMIMENLIRLGETSNAKERKTCFRKMRLALEEFSAKLPPTIPLLGLNEIGMWAEAGETGKPLKEIFLNRIAENLRMLEGVRKIG